MGNKVMLMFQASEKFCQSVSEQLEKALGDTYTSQGKTPVVGE